MNELKRQSIILSLVEDDIVNIKDNININDVWYLGQILENGFKGYKNYNDNELQLEYNERELERIK